MGLPSAPVERLIKIASARQGITRVSSGAVDALVESLEEKCKAISKESYSLSKHAKRKTITEEDIKLANID